MIRSPAMPTLEMTVATLTEGVEVVKSLPPTADDETVVQRLDRRGPGSEDVLFRLGDV